MHIFAMSCPTVESPRCQSSAKLTAIYHHFSTRPGAKHQFATMCKMGGKMGGKRGSNKVEFIQPPSLFWTTDHTNRSQVSCQVGWSTIRIGNPESGKEDQG
jgi:hypothetical protein